MSTSTTCGSLLKELQVKENQAITNERGEESLHLIKDDMDLYLPAIYTAIENQALTNERGEESLYLIKDEMDPYLQAIYTAIEKHLDKEVEAEKGLQLVKVAIGHYLHDYQPQEMDDSIINNPEFKPPRWYRHNNNPMRCPGQICWHHEHICEPVEHTHRVLYHLPHPSEDEEDVREEEWEEREAKREQALDYQFEKRLQKRRNLRKKLRKKKKKRNTIFKEKTREEPHKDKDQCVPQVQYKKVIWPQQAREWTREWTIEEGKKYSILHLLSGRERDYLIKCNGDQVNIEELSPKYVVLYFWWLCEGLSPIVNSHLEEELKELYRDYGHEFEVVFVALGHNEDIFRDSFSGMPVACHPT